MMKINIGGRLGTRLQSEPKGRKDFGTLCALIAEAPKGSLITLDFSNVETATASWWSAAVLPLLRMSSNEQMDLYFVIEANPSSGWLDDLRLVAAYNAQAFLLTYCGSTTARVIGPMDEVYRRTMKMVQEAGISTGAKLATQAPEDDVRPTAWNNRLRDLHFQRLLRRVKQGREQLYYPVIEVASFDG